MKAEQKKTAWFSFVSMFLLFSFSTSIILRFHSSKVGMSSGSLLPPESPSAVAVGLRPCQRRPEHKSGDIFPPNRKENTASDPLTGDSVSLWDALDSRRVSAGAAGGLRGGSAWVLVPVV